MIKWVGATLKTCFYQKIQIKYCSRDQKTNTSQPPILSTEKVDFMNMSTSHLVTDKHYNMICDPHFLDEGLPRPIRRGRPSVPFG